MGSRTGVDCKPAFNRNERKWEKVNRMENPDPERVIRILVLLEAGQPGGIRNRWRTEAKAKTDSRRGRAFACQNRVDQ